MPMSFGVLRLADTDYIYNAQVGQRAIWEEVQRYIAAQNAALDAITGVFVDETTENYTRRYKLPTGGMLQRRGGQAQSAAVKGFAGWDVAFPLEEYGEQIAGDEVTLAYMTAGELRRHIDGVTIRNQNTVRYEILRALFNNTSRTWTDPVSSTGDLTIQPLANGDAVTYPPVAGVSEGAAENHYIVAGYVASGISNSNDPIAGIAVPELEEHFGIPTGGSNIAVLFNRTETPQLSALAAVVDVEDRFIRPGDDTAVPVGLPTLSGRTIGRHTSGAWLQEWPNMPADYLFAVHLDAPRPVVRRRDPAATGLPDGLALVSTDAEYPFRAAHWRHRFGFGVGNRLNGVIIQLKASGSYDIPTAFQ